MDERRLTAWLITRQVLTSAQVKDALEAQIRLQRQGQSLDIIGVVRQLGLLSEEKVVEVLEETGYRPPADEVVAELVAASDAAPVPDADEREDEPQDEHEILAESADGAPARRPASSDSGWGAAVSASGEVEAASEISAVAAPPRPAPSGMDERRLTAWLITSQTLTSDQVKEALEEQIRLQRQGIKLDIIGVARRKRFLTDEEVLAVLEATGYQSSIEASASAEVATPYPATAAAGAATAATPPPLPGEAPARPPTTSSGVRRGRVRPPLVRSGGTPSGGGLIAAAVLLPLGLLILIGLLRGGGPPQVASNGPPRRLPPPTRNLANRSSPAERLIDELRRELDMSSGKVPQADLDRMRAKVAQLEAQAMGVSQAQAVWDIKRRLDALENPEGGEGFRRQEEQRVGQARVERAWAELAADFRDILRQCSEQRPSSIQAAIEARRKVDLSAKLMSLLAKAETADAVASLAGAPQLFPAVGVAGYEALIQEVENFPESLRDSKRWATWQAILPRFRELRDQAAAYLRGLRRAEGAAEVGDIAAAQRAFQDARYADDPWFQAAQQLFQDPSVVAAFERVKRSAAEGGPAGAAEPLPVPGAGRSGSAGTVAQYGATWRERFLSLEHEYREAADAEKPGLVTNLGQVLGETLGLCRRSFADCRKIVSFYDEHPKVFRDEHDLQEQLKEHHKLYFEGAFAAASGPVTFRALDRWCEERGYEAWRAKLKPYLRLVASAESRAARAREGVRRVRQEAKDKVAEFADERLEQVGDGFASLLRWMRKRGYAPPGIKKDLDDLIGRAIERAGNPVEGKRLRAELASLEHTAKADDQERLKADYDKQVQNVVDDIVKRSLKAVEKVVNAGEPGLAFDLFQYVLLLDPQNDRAHKGLGHVQVNGRWLRKFEAERLKAGYAWDPKLGWIKDAERARYEKGEYFDVQAGTWSTVAAADKVHSSFDNPWVIRTEHFELRSSAPLAKSVTISTRLEAFYLAMFRQYDLFFAAKGGARLIFGMSPSQDKPLIVNFYRDEAEFRARANPPTGWAAGFYSSGPHASFFYDMGDAYSGITVLQHEVTHQILGESSPGGAPAWLAEGAAVYLEDAFFRDGVLTLGERKNHSRVVAYQQAAPGGKEHSLLDVLGFVTSADWDSGDIAKNYRGAGAVVYFLCNFDDGRYRADFVEFLRDSYYGKNPDLETYFGMPKQVLNALMRRFYDPSADVSGALGRVANASADLEAARDAFVDTCKAKDADLDQLTEAYGMLRGAAAAAEDKAANKARSRAANGLVGLRKKLTKTVEQAVRDAGGGARAARYQELTRLRQEAVSIINDKSRYPEENHGKVGQPAVDEKVNALKKFWNATPPELETPEVQRALEVLDATEPWLDELEVKDRKRGRSIEELRREIREGAGAAGLLGTKEDVDRAELDKKVRAYNATRTDLPDEIRRQVEVLNDYREMLGLPALAINTKLCSAARKHSEWMERTGTFDHYSNLPGRRTPQDRCQAEGYVGATGENIAFGYNTPEAVHEGWYNSSGHHRNMISKDWHEIGVGRAGSYWTQDFGSAKPDFQQ